MQYAASILTDEPRPNSTLFAVMTSFESIYLECYKAGNNSTYRQYCGHVISPLLVTRLGRLQPY